MALVKNPKYDLKAKYNRVLGICMICSIALLVSAFKYFPAIESDFKITKEDKDYIKVVPPPPSNRPKAPPPPQKPPILVEAPESDIEMDDIELALTDLNENDAVTGPPPKYDETVDEEPVFFVAVEQQPEPIGGIAAIQSKIEYPPLAKRAGVQGKVYVKAYVDEAGNVIKVELVRGIGAGCDEEALKAVLATPFSPGKQRGKPVKVQVTVPIRFMLR